MKNKLILLSLLTMSFFFSSCSWMEYFVFKNNSNSEITVTYELDKLFDGYGIFEHNPTVYKLNNLEEIQWDQTIETIDKDTSVMGVQIILPVNSALKFGTLSNSKYVTYDQNDFDFNLKKMTIESKQNKLNILPHQFDNYFKKRENGNIEYSIKSSLK